MKTKTFTPEQKALFRDSDALRTSARIRVFGVVKLLKNRDEPCEQDVERAARALKEAVDLYQDSNTLLDKADHLPSPRKTTRPRAKAHREKG